MNEIESRIKRVITFRRQHESGAVEECRAEVYQDGSIFVEGDDFDLVFGEPIPETLRDAIRHLESLGFELVESTTANEAR